MRSTESGAAAPEPLAENAQLAREWSRLSRAATFVALLTSPMLFILLYRADGWSLAGALLGTFIGVIAFRGLIDIVAHRLVPRPGLQGVEKAALAEDARARRRLWYWRKKFRHTIWILGTLFALLVAINIVQKLLGHPHDLSGTLHSISGLFGGQNGQSGSLLILLLQLPLLFLINFGILFGPMMLMAVRQLKGYEPGDADWGVRLDDVRGQREQKQEVTRVITLWQSGEEFRKAGGKPERGLLFIGAPGTGKTMLSKGIATSFNSPIVTMPGSGFAQMFIGMDVIVVSLMIARARRLARKWGGQCIIFIDEIDAVGLRRQALGQGTSMTGVGGPLNNGIESFNDLAFYGPHGALNPSGDLILESRAWREKLFAARAESPRALYPPIVQRVGQSIAGVFPGGMMGGMMGGGMALNQLLVQMDGVDSPPMMRRFFTNRLNTFLDATYIIPPRVGPVSLRLRPPRPRPEQLYFIGATNVPIERLDPALIRPGRMGRHIWFRTPTADDRKDIFDLYLAKVDHDPDLDSDSRRDELARITNGYSPAMIEQVCSMALTLAHSDARPHFLGGHRRGDDDDRVRHRPGDRLHPRRDPRRRDPRGRPRRRQPRLHAGRALHAPVDPQARRLARPPPGDREGGALLLLAPRGGRQARLDLRRDGRRARLLRRELHRRRRRRPERHLARRLDGRHVRYGPRAD
jgi:SpoVK/Ycf46/Vps4 family AAA+-type ATPase